MSLVLTDKFKVNGKPMFAPDEGVQIAWADIDSAESGRDEAGNQHRIVIRYDVASITFTYSHISEADQSCDSITTRLLAATDKGPLALILPASAFASANACPGAAN